MEIFNVSVEDSSDAQLYEDVMSSVANVNEYFSMGNSLNSACFSDEQLALEQSAESSLLEILDSSGPLKGYLDKLQEEIDSVVFKCDDNDSDDKYLTDALGAHRR